LLSSLHVRAIDPSSDAEITLVAERMRATLVEVLGEPRGGSMYTMDWLIERVRWHLNPAECDGQVLLCEAAPGGVVGHIIVRRDLEPSLGTLGLISTIFVVPEFRRQAVAKALIAHGEQWMLTRKLPLAATYTNVSNTRLHRLFESLGYRLSRLHGDWTMLFRPLEAAPAESSKSTE
jgi:GNAT superfamily N-acetyltransferase